MSSEQGTADLTKIGDRKFRVERVFDAPRERLFEVLTDPKLAPEWWGPRGTTTVVEEMDAVTGGSWRFATEGPDGEKILFRGVYREVTPPERIVQTFEWDGMPGHVSVDEMTLEDLGEQTKIVVLSTRPARRSARPLSRSRRRGAGALGWASAPLLVAARAG